LWDVSVTACAAFPPPLAKPNLQIAQLAIFCDILGRTGKTRATVGLIAHEKGQSPRPRNPDRRIAEAADIEFWYGTIAVDLLK
jgi:hypothetical protein